jgi:tetratricopeptide (TPR) repeat protein
MAATFEKVEKSENSGINEKINGFLQKNRKPLVIGMGGLLLLLILFIVVLTTRDTLQAKAISAVEDFTQRYEVLLIDLNEPAKAEEVQTLLDELTVFAGKNRGYAGARSYSLIAGIYTEKKDWLEAEKAWINAARAAPKIYLAPVSLFNAAVAAEEQGNISGAIDLYTEVLSLADIFPAAPRAQFSIGRLQEAQKNNEGALEAYRAVINKWPSESVWANLAQSRILVIDR